MNFNSGWFEPKRFVRCWNKVERISTKPIPLLQLEHRFCQLNGPERGQLASEWKKVVIPVCLNGRCCLLGCGVLYRINKDEGDKSMPLLPFRKDVVNAIFLKFSNEGWLSSSHVRIRNIPSDVCYDDTKHYRVQPEHRRIQSPVKHLRWSTFAKTVNGRNFY